MMRAVVKTMILLLEAATLLRQLAAVDPRNDLAAFDRARAELDIELGLWLKGKKDAWLDHDDPIHDSRKP